MNNLIMSTPSPYPFLLALVLLCACSDDEDNRVVSTFNIESINGIKVDLAVTQDFCEEGERLQLFHGGSWGQRYYSVYGSRLWGVFGNDGDVGRVATWAIGSHDVIPDTIQQPLSSNIRVAQADAEGVLLDTLYLSLYLEHEGKIYSTFEFDKDAHEVEKYDAAQTSNVDIRINEVDICPGTNSLIVETEWTYSGYAYNVDDYSDSIYLGGVEVALRNHGY